MTDVIERYLYDVTRRLPEKDREEVGNELRANIYDMLPDDADDNAKMAVISQFGPPSLLAGKYMQKQRYLISPAVYDEYISVLKIVVFAIGGIALAIGVIMGIINAFGTEAAAISRFMTRIIRDTVTRGLSMGLNAAFQAAFWTTVGFIIYERTSGAGSVQREWKPQDLPAVPQKGKNAIPLTESIGGLIVLVVFSMIAVMVCVGIMPAVFINFGADRIILNTFHVDFLKACIPAIIISALFGAAEYFMKIIVRRWTPAVCAAVIMSNLAGICAVLYIFSRPVIFNNDLPDFFPSFMWDAFENIRYAVPFHGAFDNPAGIVFIIIIIIVVISGLAECGVAIYKTFRPPLGKVSKIIDIIED
ncbi:MAG: hypothetical protein FWE91_03830 [Defluviitaleaceae bacterium]|nr:hypothetical protein [Defluviitaleaceae bacterium]MCL2835967.1 hypothetical protein [Defluviitaleaceae bacterium]